MHMNTDGWPVPDLPPLDDDVSPKQVLNLLLNMMTGQPPAVSANSMGHALLVNAVRLCDKAACEYNAAREAVDDFLRNREGGRISPYFRATDHVESCINALHRALLHLSSVRSTRGLPPVIDRTEWRALQVPIDRLNAMRDATEHTEQLLRDGRLAAGEAAFLKLEQAVVTLAEHEVRYSDLAHWISQVHRMVVAASSPG